MTISLPDKLSRMLTAPMNDHTAAHGVRVSPDHLCEVPGARGDGVHVGHGVVGDLLEPGLYGEHPVWSLVQLSDVTEQVLSHEPSRHPPTLRTVVDKDAAIGMFL